MIRAVRATTLAALIAAPIAAVLPALAAAQASVDFGEGGFDAGQPIEVTSDALTVDQADGSAVFNGNVVVVQGDLRLASDALRVEYAGAESGGQTRIRRILATGGVTFVNGGDAAEATEAVYSVSEGTVRMTGDVLVSQGPSALSGEALTVDLASGSGRIEGRVRTILQAGGQ